MSPSRALHRPSVRITSCAYASLRLLSLMHSAQMHIEASLEISPRAITQTNYEQRKTPKRILLFYKHTHKRNTYTYACTHIHTHTAQTHRPHTYPMMSPSGTLNSFTMTVMSASVTPPTSLHKSTIASAANIIASTISCRRTPGAQPGMAASSCKCSLLRIAGFSVIHNERQKCKQRNTHRHDCCQASQCTVSQHQAWQCSGMIETIIETKSLFEHFIHIGQGASYPHKTMKVT